MATPPDGAPIRVLLVEDDEDDALITRDMLEGHETARFEVEHCSTYDAAVRAVRQARHDVHLVDVRLGARTGLELVREAFADRPGAAVLILTGQSDHAIDLEATALGVADYLVKQQLDPAGLERAIRYAVSRGRSLDDLRRSEERYALAVRAARDGLWDWDLGTDELYLSPRWNAILGRPEGATVASPSDWFDLVHPGDEAALRDAVVAHLDGSSPLLELEHRILHSDGTWRWVLSRGLATRDGRGLPTRMAGSLSDVTDRHEAEERLRHDALHDALTRLPNRALLMDRLEHAARRTRRDGARGYAVLFLDVDRFKLVNDGVGHAAGDELLVALARRIAGVLRPGDTVARLGGDEFAVLLEGVEAPEDAARAACRVQEAVSADLRVAGRPVAVSASIGIRLASGDLAPGDVLRDADIAMYDAKRAGGGQHVLFDGTMHERRVNRLAHEGSLRDAIERDLLEVALQPIVDLATGRVEALEALARWPGGWPALAPLEFIPIAEETGLIGALSRRVLRRALAALAELRADGLVDPDVSVSVNVSARHLEDPDLPEQVGAALEEARLDPANLTLEITESALMRGSDALRRLVATISAMGVGLHLDDYGTGWSSLSALQQVPVDALKIDRSFVASLESSNEVIVRSTIALAHGLGMRVVAEGVERAEQAERLRELGCERGQGYLFSRPLPLASLREALVPTAA